MIKDKIAKIVRILSVPPIMISALMLILFFSDKLVFSTVGQLIVSIILLGMVPALAYPLQKVLPKYREMGRQGQRKLAFIATFIGYSIAFIWGKAAHVNDGLFLVISTYFFSVFILIFFNKVVHFKASGHASSFTGPLLTLIYFFGSRAVAPCVLLALLISWSSVYLKRHTRKELIGGFLACSASFGISLLLITIR